MGRKKNNVRVIKRKQKNNTVVIGVDSGNSSMGMAVFVDGQYRKSATLCPWEEEFSVRVSLLLSTALGTTEYDGPVRVFCEVPQNGTHASRGGVREATGMALQALRSCNVISFSRSHKTNIRPNEWRGLVYGKHVGGRGWDWKALAITKVREMFAVEPGSHDEAEAILIAYAGASKSSPR